MPKSFHLITIFFHIFKYQNLLHFSVILQVEFHAPDYDVALNWTCIVTRDIILRSQINQVIDRWSDVLVLTFQTRVSLFNEPLKIPEGVTISNWLSLLHEILKEEISILSVSPSAVFISIRFVSWGIWTSQLRDIWGKFRCDKWWIRWLRDIHRYFITKSQSHRKSTSFSTTDTKHFRCWDPFYSVCGIKYEVIGAISFFSFLLSLSVITNKLI